MNLPNQNEAPVVVATDSSAVSEVKESRELSRSEVPASADGSPVDGGEKKPAKRGVRGPRRLRRTRAPRAVELDKSEGATAPVTGDRGGDLRQPSGVEGEADGGKSQRTARESRKRDEHAKGRSG